MPREIITTGDIMLDRSNKANKIGQRRTVDIRTPFNYKQRQDLYSNLAIPSYVHGYSLAIEYMKAWFLEKFPPNYFKTVYVNGKHVLDDFKQFNRDVIKKEKPMVAIVPTVEYDFDRETVDLYSADPSIFLRRTNFQKAFFQDPHFDHYLGMNFQALRMNFNFRVRVSSRAQQLDLFKRMELMFRIGATQSKYISADFHIPKDLMVSIAEKAAFKVDKKNNTIYDIVDFVNYMNSHSELPIMFKMRAINQKPEFFMRVKGLYTHISTRDKISLDDGERDGQLDNNFHIEMQAQLTIPVPHFYVYFSADPLYTHVNVEDPGPNQIGLYSFNVFEIPPENKLGWSQYAITSYITDKGETEIDISSLFSGHMNLDTVVHWSLKNLTSPKSFIDIQIFRNEDKAKFVRSWVDYEKMILHLMDPVDEENLNIVIYADRKYINDTIVTIEGYNKSRIDT